MPGCKSPQLLLRASRRWKSSSTEIPANKLRFVPESGSYPLGFEANSVSTAVKKTGAPDLTLVHSPAHPCVASAVFTKNAFCAAPVQLSKIITALAEKSGLGLHSLIVNSGCANACTGEKGLEDAKTMVQSVDAALKNAVQPHPKTIVMSTGVIGQPLQMTKISKGIIELAGITGSSHEHWVNAAKGIMTTDTFPKLKSGEFELATGGSYRMAGLCKGAGMSTSFFLDAYPLSNSSS